MWQVKHVALPVVAELSAPGTDKKVTLRGGGWRECDNAGLSTYVMAVLGTEREKLERKVEMPTLRRYVYHLLQVMEWLEDHPEQREIKRPITFAWRDAEGDYAFQCLRGELLCMSTLWIHELLQTEEIENWQQAVRLMRWINLAQLNAWSHRQRALFPVVCTETAQRRVLAKCLLRLQLYTITEWEKQGAKGATGVRLCKWAVVHAKRLSADDAAFTRVESELEGVMWLYNHQKRTSPTVYQNLLRCALVRFEELGLTERMEQAQALILPSSLGGDIRKANALLKHVKPLCVAVGHPPLLRPLDISTEVRTPVFA